MLSDNYLEVIQYIRDNTTDELQQFCGDKYNCKGCKYKSDIVFHGLTCMPLQLKVLCVKLMDKERK